ncbi:geranylgeranyl reductase family protein [Nocardioides bruguierae]|uniref:geranylgeranyl reductase family protein n=1 Tax=Nocardioides bruguierae TaxID=2945102 RepID=UPI0020221145|nr:geranylgeranyl reductase family protein [Nocardioides bruguierae]MCL8023786.1 geranylgeranyl reductase family protein [Nocardioides bruguierae]
MSSASEEFDVAVVGAGPAGSSAARAAAQAVARVVLLERAAFPRYKTCGGGLIGPSLAALPGTPPARAEVLRVSTTLRGGAPRERHSPDGGPVLRTAARTELDAWLADAASSAGADVRLGVGPVTVPDDAATSAGPIELRTADGLVRASTVIGADGTSSRVARAVGVRVAETDLGLEVELDAGGQAAAWADRVHLDWGPLPGSYGWVFPKGDSLTVGVIAAKGRPAETQAYLRALVEQQGLAGLRVLHDSGHLTRCRTPDSPLGRGRLLVAGDAAGLLEPWTREGISFAVRSGLAAGRVAAEVVLGGGPSSHLGSMASAYEAALAADLLPEMAAGRRCLAAFERRPAAFHHLLAGPGWRSFTRLTRGETTLARAWEHGVVRAGIALLSAAGGRGARSAGDEPRDPRT